MKGLHDRGTRQRFASSPSGIDRTHDRTPVPKVPTEPVIPDPHPEGSRWRLSLFGGPTLHGPHGEEIALTPSHRRLLTLVWGHSQRGIPRGSVIWLLWEEEDDRRSRHRLRQLLHDLGSRAGFRAVAPDGDDTLLPANSLVDADLEAFRVALGDRRLGTALEMHRRGFASLLEGRASRGEFEDWLLAKREGLRRQLRDAAAAQWDRYRPASAWEPAREAAEVLWALDPDSEAAVQKLVEARAMTGSLEAAEAVAADFLERTPEGTTAWKESQRMLDRIRRMQPVQTFLPSHTPPPPPLVGRRAGLATARRMLARVGEGSFEFLLVSGEAGAGKTRFMEEIWKEANLAGFRCLEARPVEVERRIPLNPLVDMMEDAAVIRHIRALEEPWRAVVASLLPTLPEGMDPPVVPPIAESSLSRRLLDAFATLFAQIAEEEPLLLFVDDLQWADATTVAVLQFVQRRWRSGPLGIIATVRPDQVGKGDAVAKYLTDTPDLPVTTVELGELSDTEARTLVDLVAGQEMDAAEAGRLCALGGRNPFYLIELTRDYLAGKVHLPELPTDAITLPISLRQLLDPRIQSLGPDAITVASYLAVWGRDLGLSDLARLTHSSVGDAAQHTESLERARLAVVERGKVRLAHQLFRSAIYQGLTATRRALLHGQIAEFLEQTEGAQAGELATHYDRAGNSAGAATRGKEAADKALESGAMAEAAHFFQLVVDNEADATRKAEATADLARVLHMNREIMRANPLLELAASRLRAVGNHARALRMDVRRVEGLAEVGAAPLSELLDRLATIKATARADNDDEALALALDSELHLLHRSGEVDSIRQLFAEIRVVAASSEPAAACLANASLALNVLFGDADEALRCAREAVRLAEGGEHALSALSRFILVLVTRGELGKPEYALTLVRAAQIAERSGDLALRFQVVSNQGVYFMDIGDLDRADTFLAKAGALIKGADASVLRISHFCNRGELALVHHEYEEARSWFTSAESLLGPTIPSFYRNITQAGLGLASLELGALSESRQREAVLDPLPEPCYYDPFLVILFISRMHERRGDANAAVAVLDHHRTELRARFPGAWLRLEVRRATVARKAGVPMHVGAPDALTLAQNLGLTALAENLARVGVGPMETGQL